MIIANKYKILEEIGKGAFGKVYKGENIRTKELVAIKVEKVNEEIKSLKYETQIYQALTSGQNINGFVQVKWFGLMCFWAAILKFSDNSRHPKGGRGGRAV